MDTCKHCCSNNIIYYGPTEILIGYYCAECAFFNFFPEYEEKIAYKDIRKGIERMKESLERRNNLKSRQVKLPDYL